MSVEKPITEVSNRVKRKYRVYTRRKLSELRAFYRSIMNDTKIKVDVRMDAGKRLQELFQLELEERQMQDAQEMQESRNPDQEQPTDSNGPTKIEREAEAQLKSVWDDLLKG